MTKQREEQEKEQKSDGQSRATCERCSNTSKCKGAESIHKEETSGALRGEAEPVSRQKGGNIIKETDRLSRQKVECWAVGEREQ